MGDTHRNRRTRNNEAVKKSRAKSRKQTENVVENFNKLKTENVKLNMKIKSLMNELRMYKQLFMEQAANPTKLILTKEQIQFLEEEDNVGEGARMFNGLHSLETNSEEEN